MKLPIFILSAWINCNNISGMKLTIYCKFVCLVQYGSVRNLIESKSSIGSIQYGSYIIAICIRTVPYRTVRIQYFYEIHTYRSNSLIIFYYITFAACPPCKLKLFTWSQVDSMIDMLCEGPEYNTKLKVITEDKDVEKLKERAARERARASRAAHKLDEGASTSTGSGGAKPKGKGPKKAGSGAPGIGESFFKIILIFLNPNVLKDLNVLDICIIYFLLCR